MTNRFGLDLHPKEVRWAVAEGVSEDVIPGAAQSGSTHFARSVGLCRPSGPFWKNAVHRFEEAGVQLWQMAWPLP